MSDNLNPDLDALEPDADTIAAVGFVVYALMAESATAGVRARQDDDGTGAAVLYGRVSALFDMLLALGLPAPAESPVEVMMEAEAAVAEYDELAGDGSADYLAG